MSACTSEQGGEVQDHVGLEVHQVQHELLLTFCGLLSNSECWWHSEDQGNTYLMFIFNASYAFRLKVGQQNGALELQDHLQQGKVCVSFHLK